MKKVKKWLCMLGFLAAFNVQAQVKIGANAGTINPGSLLELESTTKGVLFPRMSTVQMNAISAPPMGLVVYNTDSTCLCSYGGSKWINLCRFKIWLDTQNTTGLRSIVPLANNTATGTYSLAVGVSSVATNYASVALGNYCRATGDRSFAAGDRDTATGNHSVCLGMFNNTKGYGSIALGENNKANADYAVTVGVRNISNGYGSFAAGENNRIIDQFGVVTGRLSVSGGRFSLALGLSDTTGADYSIAVGQECKARGIGSVAMGQFNNASGNNSFALGKNTRATGNYSTSIGSDDTASGMYCTAIGKSNRASGFASFALGDSCQSTGYSSLAVGYNAKATGAYSVCMGDGSTASGASSYAAGFATNASGAASTAMGQGSVASGSASVALGFLATASGNYSAALGSRVSTNGQAGSFYMGDNSSVTTHTNSTTNQFRARFANGYTLYSNATATIGVSLAAGGNSWATVSDSTKKTNFLPVNGESVLNKIAHMKLSSWNYKTQDKTMRHYGPMAQDFYAAFGRDGIGTIGCDTLIASADFDGINLIAIQALEKRTAELQQQNEMLLKRLAALEARQETTVATAKR